DPAEVFAGRDENVDAVQLSIGAERFLGVGDVHHGELRVLGLHDRCDFERLAAIVDLERQFLARSANAEPAGQRYRYSEPASCETFGGPLSEGVDAIDEHSAHSIDHRLDLDYGRDTHVSRYRREPCRPGLVDAAVGGDLQVGLSKQSLQ